MNRLWQKDSPIIDSIMVTDVYKILMLYLMWRFFPNLHVRFSFKNRTVKVRLGDEIDFSALCEQIRHAQWLRFGEDDIAHIRSWQMFPEEFLQALLRLRLPEILVEKTPDGQLRIEAEGRWMDVTLWELLVLPIVSEMRTRFFIGEGQLEHRSAIESGEQRLIAKMPLLRELLPLRVAFFDLRRRATGDWERHTTEMLLNEIPQVVAGVSNVWLARILGVEAIGTNAHELPMALTALRSHEGPEAMRNAQYEVLKLWQRLYGHKSLVMLPDTFGDRQFFRGLAEHYFRDWRGSRHDSGDPFEYGEARIKDYTDRGIDPTQKVIIYSDGLTPEVMVELKRRFFTRIGLGYGWGTNKSHDLGVPGFGPLSLVMKLTEAAGKRAVKLSGNIAKATGDPEAIGYYKEVFRYGETFTENPVY
jgi:nicotinate phosphoribosyltransferase